MAKEHGPRRAVALLIGISEYRHAGRVPSLRYAVPDATALADLLVAPDVGAFPADDVVLLSDAEASRDRIVNRLAHWLPARAKGAELAVIYFAGHGLVHAVGEQQQGFLLAHDADPDDVITRGVSMADVTQWVGAIQASAVVVCLDCCHAGKALGPAARAVPRDLELRPSVLERMAGHGRFLIASCDQGQQSFESDDLGHGLFTYHLLRGLEGAGDQNGDGRVGVSELFHYVSRAVADDARRLFHQEQTPWTSAFYRDEVWISRTRTVAEHAVSSPLVSLEEALESGDEARLLTTLRGLKARPDVAAIPLLCRCLARRSEAVRQHAQKALRTLSWRDTTAAIEVLARAGDERMADVLEGLAAFESHPEVVALLDRLIELLRGELRNRAILLLEHKRLSLEMERMVQLFDDIRSPYKLEKVLGQGLCTASYLARADDLPVVVRVLRPELACQPAVRARFLDLSKRSRQFVHQNLVLTREVRSFAEQHVHFAVRDFVDGITLQKALDEGKRFLPEQVIPVARQVLAALTPLHQAGQAHGGIKPANIFLCGADRLVLGDPTLAPQALGLALDRLSYDYRYVAPEALTGEGKPAADFYALGCVLYELLCGQPPFVADSYMELATRHLHDEIPPLSQFNPSLPAAWHCFVERLLQRRSQDRYPSLDAALAGLTELEQALRGPRTPPPAPPLLRDASLERMRDAMSLVPFDPTATTPPATMSDSPLPEISKLPTIPGYEILEVLGQGGMGAVYKARQLALERIVALKVLPPSVTSSPEWGIRFRREAVALARLDHPNIVRVYDLSEHQGQWHFSMELCEGGSLSRRIRQGGKLPPHEAATLLHKLAGGVQYAHNLRVLHRDLKPSNILLTEAGEPKIADYGLARLQEARPDVATQTSTGVLLGTPSYMAPEQIMAAHSVGPATDIYGLGAILYELLTGRRVVEGKSVYEVLTAVMHKEPTPPRQLNPEVDAELNRICLRCLAKRPEDRYRSAADLAADLRRWLPQFADSAPSLQPPAARSRKSCLVALLLALATTGLLGWLALH